MKKIKAAGDEQSRWEACSEDELIYLGFEEELNLAKDEIKQIAAAGVLESGPVWTDFWYRYQLSWIDQSRWLIAIPEENAKKFLSNALKSPEGFDFLKAISITYIRHKRTLCPPVLEFVVGVLSGTIEKPKRRGPPVKSEVWTRNFMLHYAAGTIETRYSIPLTRNAEQKPRKDKKDIKCAVSDLLVAAVRSELGAEMNLGNVQNTLTDKKIRVQFEEIRHLYWQAFLDDLD